MVVERPLKEKPTSLPAPGRGGSALKRLRSSLRAAGAIGPGVKKKKNFNRMPNEAGRNEMREKLKVVREEMNPFEIKTTKVKFDVLGRKVKGVKGRPGVTKQVGDDNVGAI